MYRKFIFLIFFVHENIKKKHSQKRIYFSQCGPDCPKGPFPVEVGQAQ